MSNWQKAVQSVSDDEPLGGWWRAPRRKTHRWQTSQWVNVNANVIALRPVAPTPNEWAGVIEIEAGSTDALTEVAAFVTVASVLFADRQRFRVC